MQPPTAIRLRGQTVFQAFPYARHKRQRRILEESAILEKQYEKNSQYKGEGFYLLTINAAVTLLVMACVASGFYSRRWYTVLSNFIWYWCYFQITLSPFYDVHEPVFQQCRWYPYKAILQTCWVLLLVSLDYLGTTNAEIASLLLSKISGLLVLPLFFYVYLLKNTNDDVATTTTNNKPPPPPPPPPPSTSSSSPAPPAPPLLLTIAESEDETAAVVHEDDDDNSSSFYNSHEVSYNKAIASENEKVKEITPRRLRFLSIPSWNTFNLNAIAAAAEDNKKLITTTTDNYRRRLQNFLLIRRPADAASEVEMQQRRLITAAPSSSPPLLHCGWRSTTTLDSRSIVVLSVVMVIAYTTLSTLYSQLRITFVCGLLILLLGLTAIIVQKYKAASQAPVFFDPGYLYFYTVIITHLPAVLAPTLQILINWNINTYIEPVMPLFFAILVQLLLWLTLWILNYIGGPFLYSKFLFVAQLFRYVFWYIGFAITPLGLRFFLMILTMSLISILETAEIFEPWRRCFLSKLGCIKLNSEGHVEYTDGSSSSSGSPNQTPPTHLRRSLSSSLPLVADDDDAAGGAAASSSTHHGALSKITYPPQFENLPTPNEQAAIVQQHAHLQQLLKRNSLPTRHYEYYLASTHRHIHILSILFEIRCLGQDLLADCISITTLVTLSFVLPVLRGLVATPAAVSGATADTTAAAATNPIAHLELERESLYIRFLLMLVFRVLSHRIIRSIFQLRLKRTVDDLVIWSIVGTEKDELNPYTIHLGMESLLRRSLVRALTIYLQNQGVDSSHIRRYLHGYTRDVGQLIYLDLNIVGKRGFEYTTLENLSKNSFYFIMMALSVIYAVLGSYDQSNRWSLLFDHK